MRERNRSRMHPQTHGRELHGAFVRAANTLHAFAGTLLKVDRNRWLFSGAGGEFTVDPTRIVWCFPRERPAPPEGWQLLRRAAKHLASNLFTNPERTEAYELLARIASDLLHQGENVDKPPPSPGTVEQSSERDRHSGVPRHE